MAITQPQIIEPETVPVNPGEKQVHLPFLDGIRALMALWVMSGHAVQDFIHVVDNYYSNANFLNQPLFQQAFYAHFAVDVFIVLSGFCLMLPVARTSDFHLSGGWKRFLTRRATRILPPYYAALVLAIVMSGIRWWIGHGNWESRVIEEIDFRPSALVAHALLVQNMWDPWARSLDGPTWSVATECQIYVLFPFLLLPLWRKFNPVIVICVVSAIGIGILFSTWNLTKSGLTSCAWFLGLFAIGMCSAAWYVRQRSAQARPWLLTGSVFLVVFTVLTMSLVQWDAMLMWKLDFAVGLAAGCLLAYFASYNGIDRKPLFQKFLEWSPLVTLGTFSYSLYLIHVPLLNVPITLLMKYRAGELVAAVCIVLSLIAIIGLSYVFYRSIELPAMTKKRT